MWHGTKNISGAQQLCASSQQSQHFCTSQRQPWPYWWYGRPADSSELPKELYVKNPNQLCDDRMSTQQEYCPLPCPCQLRSPRHADGCAARPQWSWDLPARPSTGLHSWAQIQSNKFKVIIVLVCSTHGYMLISIFDHQGCDTPLSRSFPSHNPWSPSKLAMSFVTWKSMTREVASLWI